MADFTPKEKYEGEFNGKDVHFNRSWGGHRFSDEECEALCNGDEIEFDFTSAKTHKKFHVVGTLQHDEYNGHGYYGFKPDWDDERTKELDD